tara:strand:- start:24 stop:686 length:663 start_codon:yes stop_codon:yes gene_type:complete
MPNAQLFVRDTTNNKNVPLEVDGSNKLSVSDSTAQSSLSSISSTLGGTLTVSDSTAQSTLSSINSAVGGTLQTSNSTAESHLSNIASSVAGTLSVSDSTAQATLSSINTSLSGTLTTSAGVSRTNGNLSVATSVTNGDVTSSVDANNFKHAIIFGNLGASGDVVIQVSNDNSNFTEVSNDNFFSNYSNYDVSGRFECTARYWRVKYNITGTVTLRYALMA